MWYWALHNLIANVDHWKNLWMLYILGFGSNEIMKVREEVEQKQSETVRSEMEIVSKEQGV